MPTLKQKKVVKELSENIGLPLGEAMRRAGYSKRTSETPQRLTDSKGWEELMKEHLPDKKLIEVHKAGLKATFTDKFNTDEPDYSTRHKYLESAYKLKGSYAAEKHEVQVFTLEDLFKNAKSD
jgi:hypothetical protein